MFGGNNPINGIEIDGRFWLWDKINDFFAWYGKTNPLGTGRIRFGDSSGQPITFDLNGGLTNFGSRPSMPHGTSMDDFGRSVSKCEFHV